jgi:hypothetical protein
MSLKPFNPKALCPKCRSKDIGTLFCNAVESVWMAGSWNGGGKGHDHECHCTAFQEHFHRNCHRCEYEWFEAVVLTDEGRKDAIAHVKKKIAYFKKLDRHQAWKQSAEYYLSRYEEQLGF